jgi:hypothetical protein
VMNEAHQVVGAEYRPADGACNHGVNIWTNRQTMAEAW